MKKNLLLFLLVMAARLLHAQTAATNTGILYISGGADIFYAGSDFTNNSGASLTNNGQLHVKGNLSNSQAAMSAGTGTLYLDGNSAQIVGGSQAFRTYHLNTNNSAGITLNNNLSVSGIHTFANGVITTSATPNYLIYEAGSSYTGDGDTKHVNGWVKKIGNSNFVFPLGNGTIERTIALNSLSASSEFDATYLATTPNPNSKVPPVWDVDDPEYWSINRVSGGTATATLNWNSAKVYFPNWILTDILVTGYNGTAWTDNGGAGTATGSVATTGSVTSGTLSSFNLFTFGSRSYVLPLTLLSFEAIHQASYTELKWITEREFNTDRFLVERSDNGISFYTIDQVKARNTNTTEQYSSRDNLPVNGMAWYRLHWIDASGQEHFSAIITIKLSNGDAQLNLVANPVKDKIRLSALGPISGEFRYSLTNIAGQLVQQGTMNVQNPGLYEIALRETGVGVYWLRLTGTKQSFSYQVIVR